MILPVARSTFGINFWKFYKALPRVRRQHVDILAEYSPSISGWCVLSIHEALWDLKDCQVGLLFGPGSEDPVSGALEFWDFSPRLAPSSTTRGGSRS